MITRSQYEQIAKKYGHVSSWAIWGEDVEGKPKANMGDMSVFNLDKNKSLLKTLKTDIIIVGLNFSRDVHFKYPFQNFHDSDGRANDFKLRYALKGTHYYGAYMTDIIKDYPKVDSNEVKKDTKDNPSIISDNIAGFKKELEFIGANKPLIICLGTQVYDILSKNLEKDYYSVLIKIYHYSYRIGKEKYKEKVLSILD